MALGKRVKKILTDEYWLSIDESAELQTRRDELKAQDDVLKADQNKWDNRAADALAVLGAVPDRPGPEVTGV